MTRFTALNFITSRGAMMDGIKWKILNVANVGWLTIVTQDVVTFGLEAVGVCTLIWFNVERAIKERRQRQNEKN